MWELRAYYQLVVTRHNQFCWKRIWTNENNLLIIYDHFIQSIMGLKLGAKFLWASSTLKEEKKIPSDGNFTAHV